MRVGLGLRGSGRGREIGRTSVSSSCELVGHENALSRDGMIAHHSKHGKRPRMHILIVRNNSNSQAIDASLLLITYLATQGIDYTVVDSSKLASPLAAPELSELFDHGVTWRWPWAGTGTILRTARQVGFRGTPILGINYGRLGFLANPNESGVMEPLVAALSGDAAHEVRTNLDIRVVCEGEADPYADDGAGAEPDEQRDFFALNEVAVTRGANGRIIDFGLGVSGSHLANMRGDGLVVASATGSTGLCAISGRTAGGAGFHGPGGRAHRTAYAAFPCRGHRTIRCGGDGPVRKPG